MSGVEGRDREVSEGGRAIPGEIVPGKAKCQCKTPQPSSARWIDKLLVCGRGSHPALRNPVKEGAFQAHPSGV